MSSTAVGPGETGEQAKEEASTSLALALHPRPCLSHLQHLLPEFNSCLTGCSGSRFYTQLAGYFYPSSPGDLEILVFLFFLLCWSHKPSFGSKCSIVCVHAQSFSCAQLFVTLWTAARQVCLSMVFSRQEYWSRFPCPFPGNLPHPEIERKSPEFPTLASRCFTIEPLGKPQCSITSDKKFALYLLCFKKYSSFYHPTYTLSNHSSIYSKLREFVTNRRPLQDCWRKFFREK